MAFLAREHGLKSSRLEVLTACSSVQGVFPFVEHENETDVHWNLVAVQAASIEGHNPILFEVSLR